jgi:hypothetical protein
MNLPLPNVSRAKRGPFRVCLIDALSLLPDFQKEFRPVLPPRTPAEKLLHWHAHTLGKPSDLEIEIRVTPYREGSVWRGEFHYDTRSARPSQHSLPLDFSDYDVVVLSAYAGGPLTDIQSLPDRIRENFQTAGVPFSGQPVDDLGPAVAIGPAALTGVAVFHAEFDRLRHTQAVIFLTPVGGYMQEAALPRAVRLLVRPLAETLRDGCAPYVRLFPRDAAKHKWLDYLHDYFALYRCGMTDLSDADLIAQSVSHEENVIVSGYPGTGRTMVSMAIARLYHLRNGLAGEIQGMSAKHDPALGRLHEAVFRATGAPDKKMGEAARPYQERVRKFFAQSPVFTKCSTGWRMRTEAPALPLVLDDIEHVDSVGSQQLLTIAAFGRAAGGECILPELGLTICNVHLRLIATCDLSERKSAAVAGAVAALFPDGAHRISLTPVGPGNAEVVANRVLRPHWGQAPPLKSFARAARSKLADFLIQRMRKNDFSHRALLDKVATESAMRASGSAVSLEHLPREVRSADENVALDAAKTNAILQSMNAKWSDVVLASDVNPRERDLLKPGTAKFWADLKKVANDKDTIFAVVCGVMNEWLKGALPDVHQRNARYYFFKGEFLPRDDPNNAWRRLCGNFREWESSRKKALTPKSLANADRDA